MRQDKITVGMVFGGKSGEHDVSIESARAICRNIDRKRYTPRLIYINKEGNWAFIEEEALMQAEAYQETGLTKNIPERFFSLSPWEGGSTEGTEIDIYFPILHGPNGEDGKIQGLWEMVDKPFVGANSFASALAMDKGVAKVLFRQAGLKTPDFLVFTRNDTAAIEEQVTRTFRFPVFVKPCSLGSSVGISKAKTAEELKGAIDLAFAADRKIIIEQGLDAREIEISVIGNDDLLVSPPGEIFPANEFYDYADKYLDGKTRFHMPAQLEEKAVKQIQSMAREAFRTLDLNGMARIDFFVEKGSRDIYINEINTIPGFTEISMFPKLFGLIDISFTQLVSRLIEYGFQYHQKGRRQKV